MHNSNIRLLSTGCFWKRKNQGRLERAPEKVKVLFFPLPRIRQSLWSPYLQPSFAIWIVSAACWRRLYFLTSWSQKTANGAQSIEAPILASTLFRTASSVSPPVSISSKTKTMPVEKVQGERTKGESSGVCSRTLLQTQFPPLQASHRASTRQCRDCGVDAQLLTGSYGSYQQTRTKYGQRQLAFRAAFVLESYNAKYLLDERCVKIMSELAWFMRA